MRNIYSKLKYVFLALWVIIILSFVMIDNLYSGINDNSDRLSNEQSSVFSPGYINASRQHTYEIINQQNKPKSFIENAVDYVKNVLSNKVEEKAADKPMPELKKKTSAKSETASVESRLSSEARRTKGETPNPFSNNNKLRPLQVHR